MPRSRRRAPRPDKRKSSNARRRNIQRREGIQRSGRPLPWFAMAAAAVVLAVAAAAAVLFAGTHGLAGPSPTPTAPSIATAAPTLARRIDGIPCNNNNVTYHVHAHLQLLFDGREVVVPANIGIDNNTCVYYVHTHDTSGEIHIEAPSYTRFTLGNLFDIWGQPLSKSQVASLPMRKDQHVRVYLNGKRYVGDPRQIELLPHRLIALEVGPPFVPPAGFDFQGD